MYDIHLKGDFAFCVGINSVETAVYVQNSFVLCLESLLWAGSRFQRGRIGVHAYPLLAVEILLNDSWYFEAKQSRKKKLLSSSLFFLLMNLC